MKLVAEIIVAVTILVSGNYLASKLIEKFKKETLVKLDKGLFPLSSFTSELINKK